VRCAGVVVGGGSGLAVVPPAAGVLAGPAADDAGAGGSVAGAAAGSAGAGAAEGGAVGAAAGSGAGPGGANVKLGEFDLVAGGGDTDTRGKAMITIRPERVVLEPGGGAGPNRIPGMIERVVYVGSVLHVFVNLAPGDRIQAWISNDGDATTWAQGTAVAVHLPQDALRVLPPGGEAPVDDDEALPA